MNVLHGCFSGASLIILLSAVLGIEWWWGKGSYGVGVGVSLWWERVLVEFGVGFGDKLRLSI